MTVLHAKLRASLKLVTCLASVLVLAACQKMGQDELPALSKRIATNLEQQLRSDDGDIVIQKPIVVSTIVHVESLEDSSAITQILTEQISGHLSTLEVPVKAVKMRQNVLVKKGGVYLLSRDAEKVLAQHKADAVMTGTYAISKELLALNVRVLDAGDSEVLASDSRQIPMTDEIESLVY